MARKRKTKRKSKPRKKNAFDDALNLGGGFGFGTFVKSKDQTMFGLKMPKNKATGGLVIPKIAKQTGKGFDVTRGFDLPQIEIGMTPDMMKVIPDFDEGVEDEPEVISRNFPRDRALEGQPPRRELSDEELDELEREEEERRQAPLGADVSRQTEEVFQDDFSEEVPSLFDSLVDKSLGERIPVSDEEEESRRRRGKGFEDPRRFGDEFEDVRFKQVSQGAAPLTELEAINFRRGRSIGGKLS